MQAIAVTRDVNWRELICFHLSTSNKAQASLWAEMDVPEATGRGWLNAGRSPSIDWALKNRDLIPADAMATILQVLAGPRYVVAPADDEATEATHPVMQDVIDLHELVARLSRHVFEAEADHTWSIDESRAATPLIFACIKQLQRIAFRVARCHAGTFLRRIAGRRLR